MGKKLFNLLREHGSTNQITLRPHISPVGSIITQTLCNASES